MQTDVIFYVVALVVLASVIMAVYSWRTNKNSLFLAAFLSILSLEAFTSWLYHTSGNAFLFALLLNHFAPLYTFKAPLLYFFIRGNVRDSFGLSWRDTLHFIPAVIHLLLIIPYLLVPFSDKLEIAASLIAHPEMYSLVDLKYPYPHMYNLYFRSFQFLFYSSWSFIVLARFMVSFNSLTGELQKLYRFSAKWLVLLIGVLLVVSFLQIFLVLQIPLSDNLQEATRRATALFQGGFFIYLLIPVILIAYPRFLYGFPSFSFNKSTLRDKTTILHENPSRIKESYSSRVFQNLDALSCEIRAYMDHEKPYLNPDFSIAHTATALNIPLHHVQLCVSMKFSKSFPDFVNEYRVAYACQLIRNKENSLTLEAIGEKSGFSTNSNFNDSFRAVIGMTPRQWYLSEADNSCV